MEYNEVQVIRAGKNWAVRSARKLISSHRSQNAAIEAALKFAKKERSAVIIHGGPKKNEKFH
jgi:hypothetical protein